MNNTYVRDNHADKNMTCLQCYVDPNPTLDKLIELFGEPEYACEEEKGYINEYVFKAQNGKAITLYDRWHQWRIGSHNLEDAEKFRDWLIPQL